MKTQKSIRCLALAAAAGLLLSEAVAQQVTVIQIPGYHADAGEFNITPILGSGYGAAAVVNNGFETFCISRNAGITVPGTFYYSVSVNEIYQPDNLTISKGTAWLYSSFAAGTLAGYHYDGAGIIDPGHILSQRAEDAYQLQLAFWTLEGQYWYGPGPGPLSLAEDLANPWLALVANAFGGGTGGLLAAMSANTPGGYNVGVLNLNDVNADGSRGSVVQPVLVLLTPSTGGSGCRVTGGSNKETNNWQSACITTARPSFISHGGQVGASLSGETPFSPYSPCISGELQHNRHLTKQSLVGNFHASGNGNVHQFDSLLCACLPCDENPFAVGTVGEICNPNDRICGPTPRRAPANKICFSGVGDYTYSNGPKTVKAVFRVDIEDRGEGNSRASSPPADRYRIRLWLLDPACGRSYGPDSAQGLALRLAVSADPVTIASLATTENLKFPLVAGAPDIDDGGDMTQGNQQIHPETGAVCK